MHNEEHKHHSPSYSIYILVWLALMTMTAITVAVAGINLGFLTVTTALTIASVKSYLVLTIFMHLRVEQKVFKIFVGAALLFIIVSLVLLFADYTYL